MGVNSSKPSFRALLLGLDSAGKTTLLKGLTSQEIPEGPTTTHNIGSLKLKKGSALLFDLGGQQKLITFWRQYYSGTGIILFVIDSSDTQRVHNAKDELYRLIHEEELIGIPLLVIANKQDMPGALSPQDIAAELELNYLEPRTVAVLPASAKSQEGFPEIRQWVQDNAVHVVDIPHHLELYNQQLALLRAQDRKKSLVVSHSQDNGEGVEDSLRITAHVNSTNTATHSTHSTDTNNTNNPTSNTNPSNQSGKEISTHTNPTPNSPQSNSLTENSKHNSTKDPNHHDPHSISVSHISTTGHNTALRKPRLTLSVEQRVLQQQLHQQLLAHSQLHNQDANSNTNTNTTQYVTEELNHEGIPINSRHGDDFTPQQDDVILETKIMLSETSQARKGSILRARTHTQDSLSIPDSFAPRPGSTTASTKDDAQTAPASHFTTNVIADPQTSPQLHSHSSPDAPNVVTPDADPTPISSPPQQDPNGCPSQHSIHDPQDHSIPRRTSITSPSPSQRNRRRSSATTPLSTEEIEGMARSRKISLSQREMEVEMEEEYEALHDNPVAPVTFEESATLQQEPDLDTVKEQQLEEDAVE